MGLREEVVEFRDRLKAYRNLVRTIIERSERETAVDELLAQEEAHREALTEMLGRLHGVLERLPGVHTWYPEPSTGYNVSFFDEALSPDLDGPRKGVSLEFAIQSATKAVGVLAGKDESELRAIVGGRPLVFLSYSFRPANEEIVGLIRQLLVALGFDVLEGDDPRPASVSSKVKSKIGRASAVVSLMTRDVDEGGTSLPSTWVIEEATYGLAQNKPVVRMIEDGVSTEGRIFGDQEYIPLERANPAKALVRLARMLGGIRESE